MKLKSLLTLLLLLCCMSSFADEGMWLLGNVNKQMRSTMKDMGLQMPFDKVYSPDHRSLSDAVVSFGGFCSGVVVSDNGLVFTNHHCGFNSIQQHSSVEHDYLKDGFVSHSMEEELPNPELYVRFLLRTEDVTQRMLQDVNRDMTEDDRMAVLDSMANVIITEMAIEDSTLIGVVDAYYGGNEYWLSVYRDYNDVRLVFAPPSSIGKFGWDTDNWVWPRHTGDFCVFRIYADKDNKPADYSPDNVPYKPDYVAPISLDGYKTGSFCMTLGYPGTTERYLSSYGVEEMMNGMNQAMIDMRGIKQDIWKKAMNNSADIRIKYATKYDESSNYWKNSIGKNRSIKQLGILEKKRMQETALSQWFKDTSSSDVDLLPTLEAAYDYRQASNRALSYYIEAFLNGAELSQLALEILNFDFEADEESVGRHLNNLIDKYENYDVEVDKEIYTAMLRAYQTEVDSVFLPPMYAVIDTLYDGNIQAYVDSLYSHSEMTSMRALQRYLEQDTTYQIINDPAIELAIDLIVFYYEMNQYTLESNELIHKGERVLTDAMRTMNPQLTPYPDANGSLRLSFGSIKGYSPFDGAFFQYYTTPKGIIEKAKRNFDDPDYAVNPRLLELFEKKDYGRYTDENGEMRVCFISDNDITGGNSGSAMFNGKGELLGLAFDGNWEAMSSDVAFEPNLQRCIGVDVRYMLFVIEKYGQATNIIDELKLK